MDLMSKEGPSIHSRLNTWLREQIEGEEKVDLVNDYIEPAVEHIMSDEELTRQFLRDNLYSYLAPEARKIMARGRPYGKRVKIIEVGGVLQDKTAYNEEAAKSEIIRDFSEVWVHAGKTNYYRLTALNRPLIDAALEEERPRLRTERIKYRFKLILKSKLPDDETTVGDYFDNDDLDELYAVAEAQVDEEMEREENSG